LFRNSEVPNFANENIKQLYMKKLFFMLFALVSPKVPYAENFGRTTPSTSQKPLEAP
jgi:hypothetical protein